MTLIHCSIFCRCLYKVPYIFYVLYFITGFAPQQQSTNLRWHGLDLLLSMCSECFFHLLWNVILHRETFTGGFTAKDNRFYLFHFFLRTFFVLKSTTKWRRVKYTSNRSVHILAGWKANNKWANAQMHCVWCPPVHTPCQIPFLPQKCLKWTKWGLSESPYRWGEVVRDCCLSMYKNGNGKKNSSGHTTRICALQVIPHWPIC